MWIELNQIVLMIKRNKIFTATAILIVFFQLTISSCSKDSPSPEMNPSMKSIIVTGESKNFEAFITFSEGVYKNMDMTGDLDINSFNVTLSGGSSMSSYVVNHSAGQINATIFIELNDYSVGTETLNISPKDGTSIYNSEAKAMASTEILTVGLDGTVHETINVKDDGNGTGDVTWTANNTYILDGLVFVNSGQTLNIEAGTVIKGKVGQGGNASALIVARGGKIMAEGTSEKPIIFTAEADDLNGSVQDLTDGLWGGVIILGNGLLNTNEFEKHIEGIPQTESRGLYGGNNNEDNSGVVKYVSIRHGGTNIGEGNEINGLTLGAVGSKTTIEYIEIFANKDDGIEFFGGAPRLKYIISAFSGDDSFDYDEGFNGYGQFWLGIQGYERGDRLGEHDGNSNNRNTELNEAPTIYNATYVGRGDGAAKKIITFQTNAGGNYANSIFYNQQKGIDIELLVDECSYTQFEIGELTFKNNIFYYIDEPLMLVTTGEGVTEADQTAANNSLAQYFINAENKVADPGFNINGNTFNVIPSNDVSQNLVATPNNWFENVTYKGAIDPTNNWTAGWSLFSKYMN